MGRDEQFDSFYHATRRALVHQTFALTGDLTAAQNAVRDAYIAAWHHWRKVSSFDDPLDWVRPRAWKLAQRRHTARLWQRTKGISSDDKAVLDAIAKLPMTQRRTLLLTQLAAVPLNEAARELGVPSETAAQHLQAATASFAVNLDVDSTSVRAHLVSLSDAASEAKLPRPSIIRRAGKKRRQSHTAIAAAVAAVVAIASGAFAYQPTAVQASDARLVRPTTPSASAATPEETLPTAEQLLDEHQIARLGMSQEWRVKRTHDNTSGNGINTICQETRFADPDGLSALVRSFEARGKPARSAVQTIEISRSAEQAQEAFASTMGWYAGCQVGRLQLLNAYQVGGVGDQAHVLMIRVWKQPVTTYSVAVARIGRVVTSTVGETVGGRAAPPAQITQSLADAVSMLCAHSDSDHCAGIPSFKAVPPPPSGEEQGILAVADLPPVGRIDEPWVGTKAQPARQNPSATTCDRANFVGSGAVKTRARTFLIPGARLPDRFGLSETYGEFRTPRDAVQFLEEMRRRLGDCEEENLATQVLNPRSMRSAEPQIDLSTWELETEISDTETVLFRLAFVRVGNKVAQLNFSPTDREDVSAEDFRALVVRAGDRLRELD